MIEIFKSHNLVKLFDRWFVTLWFVACTSWGGINYLAVQFGYLAEIRVVDSVMLIPCCLAGAFAGWLIFLDHQKTLQVFAAASLFVLLSCAMVGGAMLIFALTAPAGGVPGRWTELGYFLLGFFSMAASSWGVLMAMATLSRRINRFLRRRIRAFPFAGGSED